ncbi:MAG: prepilin-type N-terminal cleavage/methylation domain-containing protein [Mariprofundaceae bacterium]|nr:prepilin-type N-terminal cleavage/methylation domain-containing protein [Mariprofundaceae bacterium]
MLASKMQQKGFTLIEVMVAMLVSSVVLLALGQMLIVGMRSNQQSEHRMDGVALAQSALSNAVAQASSAGYAGGTVTFSSIPSGQATITVVPNPTVAGQGTDVRVVFTWDEHGSTKTINLFSHLVTQ